MRSTELAETALSMRNVTFNADDLWTTFEVIENGELGTQDFPVKDLLRSRHDTYSDHKAPCISNGDVRLSPPIRVPVKIRSVNFNREIRTVFSPQDSLLLNVVFKVF